MKRASDLQTAMTEQTQTSAFAFAAGTIPRADRIQRLVIGGALMMLTVSSLIHYVEWRGIVAIALQSELLLTGIVGWCPVYWSCRIRTNEPTSTDETSDS